MSKGSTPRHNLDQYGIGWERIFGGDRNSTDKTSKSVSGRGFDAPTSTTEGYVKPDENINILQPERGAPARFNAHS